MKILWLIVDVQSKQYPELHSDMVDAYAVVAKNRWYGTDALAELRVVVLQVRGKYCVMLCWRLSPFFACIKIKVVGVREGKGEERIEGMYCWGGDEAIAF